MRNKYRIKPLLNELERLWNEHPDLRFFQLVEYIKDGKDCFYVEDDEASSMIQKKHAAVAQR